jgi:MoaA/NifB/PqqE/SkfB family radical SAM enzyme
MNLLCLRATWDISHYCNFRCRFCLSSSGSIQPKNALSIKEAYAVIDKLYSGGVLFLTLLGGEPLAREDFLPIASYAKQIGMFIRLSTNGSLVTAEKAEGLAALGSALLHLQVSLYGVDEQSYRDTTGIEGSYSKVMQGLKNLRGAGLEFMIILVATEQNVSSIDEYCDLAMNVGAKSIYIAPKADLGRGICSYTVKNAEKTVWPVLIRKLREIKEKLQEGDPPIIIDARPAFGEFIKKITGFHTSFHLCDAAKYSIYINPNGFASPCPFLMNSPKELRDIYHDITDIDFLDHSFGEVWYSDSFERFRQLFDPQKSRIPINRSCRNFMKGVCIPCATTPCSCFAQIQEVRTECHNRSIPLTDY